jgi:hypothetical protein
MRFPSRYINSDILKVVVKDRQVMFGNNYQGGVARIINQFIKSKVSSPVRVWRPWILVEIGFLLAVIALFNLFPQLIGISRSPDAVAEPLPLVATGFITLIPWLNLWWGLALGLNLVILFFDIRQPVANWARVAVNLFGLLLLLQLVIGGPVISFNPAWTSLHSANEMTVARIEKELTPILTAAETVALSMAILALGYSSYQKIRGLLPVSMDSLAGRVNGSKPSS